MRYKSERTYCTLRFKASLNSPCYVSKARTLSVQDSEDVIAIQVPLREASEQRIGDWCWLDG